jgi:hypothetical protein
MLAFSEEKIEKHFIGPDIHSVEVNWSGVRETTALESELILRNFYNAARNSMRAQLSQLRQMVTQGERNHSDFQSRMNAAQKKTMANINTSVSRGELGEHIAREVRDASVEFLIIGATALSGGTAVAVIGTGSFLKGAYAYQDTHHVSTAVMTASTNLLMSAIPLRINAAMEARFGKLAWGILWAKTEGLAEIPKRMLEGEHLATAAGKGMVKSGLGIPHELVKHALEHSKGFGKWAIPVELAFKAIEVAGQKWVASATENQQERRAHPVFPPYHTKVEQLSAAVIYGHDEIERFAVRQVASPGLSRTMAGGARR